MASGIEAAGLALALIPLLVNQIDGYARGIEKIRLLRNYHRELQTYHTGLNTQHAILQCTLEDVLENFGDDEETVAALIENPQGAGWRDPTLQKALQRKLGRNYRPFLGNMNSLSELLERLSRKLDLSAMETDVSKPLPPEHPWNVPRSIHGSGQGAYSKGSTALRSFWKFWKILSRAVYDDLLEKIDATNTILRTLIDQANRQEERQERQKPWTNLLRRYQREQRHMESLFQTIGGSCWQCPCREHHCIHLRLQPYVAAAGNDSSRRRFRSDFHFIFSNLHATSQPGVWDLKEVIFKLQANENPQNSTTAFDGQARQKRILDLCSSLQNSKLPSQQQNTIGFISENFDATFRYIMHQGDDLEKDSLKQSLREALASFSRRERLYIAASIACSVLQCHGNWLNGQWDSSRFHLIAKTNALYLSWPLSTPDSLKGSSTLSSSDKRESVLQSLGLSLVELSLGRPLDALLSSKGESQDVKRMAVDSALRLTKEVRLESGWHYASVVDSCLSWSGVSTICRERHNFEERIFDKIVSPLLKDVMIFDGWP